MTVHQFEDVVGIGVLGHGPGLMRRKDLERLVEPGTRQKQTSKITVGDGAEQPALGVDEQQDGPARSVHPVQGGPDVVMTVNQDVLNGLHVGLVLRGNIGPEASASSTSPGMALSIRLLPISSRNPRRASWDRRRRGWR